MIQQNDMIEAEIETEAEISESESIDWLGIAKDAYRIADDYVTANVKRQMERNISYFGNKHPAESKYHSESYSHRSKIFRPKVRSAIRRNQSSLTTALFSTMDYVDVSAENKTDMQQVVSAEISKSLLNYHLENDIPWFQLSIGAYQDAMVQGVVISKQYWKYNTTSNDDILSVQDDKPVIELIPVENFLFSPASDWIDPIGTSPYLIELIPMYIGDIMQKMESGEWIEYSEGVIKTAIKSRINDSTRQTREKNRTDPTDQNHLNTQFDIAWVHHNIVKQDGIDVVFYTLGTELLLSNPALLSEIYPADGRPYKLGVSDIETHKTYPAGLTEISEGVQAEVNDVVNQRMDNVKLAMNKRYFVRRSGQVDTRSLSHSVPGGITLMKDINNDVRVEETNDVTASSYQEQDRLNVDFDEISGTFNPNTIQSQQSRRQPVGFDNMMLLSEDANIMTEYQLRVFVETWVEPVLKQVLKLVKYYETDQSIIAMAAGDLGLDPGSITPEILETPVKLRVNVGFGATNPQSKLSKLSNSLSLLGQFVPEVLQKLNPDEVAKEVFGAAGYKDGERFLGNSNDNQGDNAQLTEMQQQMQQIQQQLIDKQVEQRIAMDKLSIERERIAMETTKARAELEASMYRYGADQNLAYDRLKTDIAKMQADYKNKRDIVALQTKEKIVTNQLKQRNMQNGYDSF